MNKKRLIFIFVILLLLFMNACGKENYSANTSDTSEDFSFSTESTESTEDIENLPTEKDDEKVSIEIGNNYIDELHKDYIYESFAYWYIDLDKDSEKEQIYYEIEDKDGQKITNFYINNVNYSDIIDVKNSYKDYFFIVDVNTSDNFYEIIISDCLGFNASSQWFRFIEGKLVSLGKTNMFPGNFMYFNSDNSVTIYDRTDIFGTNFIPIRYLITNNKLNKIEEDFYNFGLMTESKYISKIELFVHTKPLLNSDTIIIDEGTIFYITKTDNKNWINIIIDDTEYWIYIKDSCFYENENISIYEAIENLI